MDKEQRTQRNNKIAELRERFWSYEDIGKLFGLTGKMVEIIVKINFPDKTGWLKQKEDLKKIDAKLGLINMENEKPICGDQQNHEKSIEEDGFCVDCEKIKSMNN